MGGKHRRRRSIQLPPELRNLRITISEEGQVDLGVCRDALMDFLRKCAENKKGSSEESAKDS